MAPGIMRITNNWFETKHKFIFILFAIYELIFLTFLKGKNITIIIKMKLSELRVERLKQELSK